jgi:long-chain acyl-CoA synthetase
MTLKDLLIEKASQMRDKTCLYWDDDEISYERIDRTARIIAHHLISHGIEKDEKVCILIPNRPEFLYSFFGIVYAGAVAVPINIQLKTAEVQYLLYNSDARMLITTPEFKAIAFAVKHTCPELKDIVMLDRAPRGTIPFEEFIKEPKKLKAREVKEEDIAGIIYTSGTTGHPKGVLLTHKNYVANAEQIATACQMAEDDRLLCILPLFHVMGLVATALSPLYSGGSMVLMKGFSPKEFLPRLSLYRATAFSGVPTVYAILNNLPDAEDYDLSALRFCICGAAPMPVEVFETFERKYKAFILEGYGLSEATCASSINPLDGRRKIGSIGVPLKNQEMKIMDENQNELPPGEIGEIVVQGPNVMKGYYKDEEATRETLLNGWLHTGDLGYIDRDGYFYIKGRKKEMVIRGGENIYPKEIEDILCEHPAISQAAVVGLPDKIWGEEVAAFVVLKKGSDVKPQELIGYCKEHLADYKCPRIMEIAKSLPMTATGRVQKTRIIEEYAKRI